ncbi:hypothetical protein TVAG_445410 [Trichomonas vaginalis G3]|uniref:Uncharacterized protein n=1 Tax=Trichomonas vaginalis (strain ATCC PRA-98 / G3) TaxID=412133 RepID=A2E4K7_TRIV3|nr:hypothetical protein TVAGG3_1050760 [Trichomonas vaginalis G3]EAY12429.1 hypothetical protein TVAG_445410 [Trichomonas vaginalis G3]KAI5494194.1 hypothetical protein TVAGG3_1050760 [Trichomonas vaginalis G3]|eukprot:XP_001324652.1 hypothetical protein [Trichomonas vaginalis G3]
MPFNFCTAFYLDGLKFVERKAPYIETKDVYEYNELNPMEFPSLKNYINDNINETVNETTNETNNDPSDSKKSNAGKIAGFTILGLVIAAAIGVGVFIFIKKYAKKEDDSDSERNVINHLIV